MGHASAEYVHTITECAKLAFADREAWYGDPEFFDVPMDLLLSREYADERRALVGDEASAELRPGGPDPQLPAPVRGDVPVAPGVGEPTRGDTVHLDVVDRFGNMVAATPSGGWLWGAPVIPELGFCLGTRAQMFWLEEGLPNSLEPGKRPRTTLSPTLVARDGEPYLALGTPGGDQQDQWTLNMLSRTCTSGSTCRRRSTRPNTTRRRSRARSIRARRACAMSRSRSAPARRRSTAYARAATTSRFAAVVARPRQRGRAGARRPAEGSARTPARCRATRWAGKRFAADGRLAGPSFPARPRVGRRRHELLALLGERGAGRALPLRRRGPGDARSSSPSARRSTGTATYRGSGPASATATASMATTTRRPGTASTRTSC